MEDVDLTISSVGAHDVLLDRLADANLLDKLIEVWERLLPFRRRNDFDNS